MKLLTPNSNTKCLTRETQNKFNLNHRCISEVDLKNNYYLEETTQQEHESKIINEDGYLSNIDISETTPNTVYLEEM